jgi:hypothetical protein
MQGTASKAFREDCRERLRTGAYALPGLDTARQLPAGQLAVQVKLPGKAVACALLSQLGDASDVGLALLCLLLPPLRLHLLGEALGLALLPPVQATLPERSQMKESTMGDSSRWFKNIQ